MMGAHDILKVALGDIPDGADVREYNTLAAKALIRAGLAVLLLWPNSKNPACILTSEQAKRADRQAQADAQAAGHPNWERVEHPCGDAAHALTDVKDLTKVRVKALLANGANLAVVIPKCSTRVIAVDVDTAEQVRGFLADWSQATGEVVDLPMTVSSPGLLTANVDGEEVWAHKDGGHFWFTVPEGTVLPEQPGKLAGDSGWIAYYGSGYVLVPPSIRPEGPYRLTGSVQEAPAWLLDAIQEHGTRITQLRQEARDRARQRVLDGPDDIDSWAAATSWADLLGPAGWRDTGGLDTCGCPTWTRPGSPAHIKSATAHDIGCPRYDTSLGHGPLHIWSDAVDIDGRKTANKLTFLAWSQFEGDMGAAMRSVGIEPHLNLPEPTVLDGDPLEEFAVPTREPAREHTPAAGPPRTAVDYLRVVEADGGVDPKLLTDPPPVTEGEGVPAGDTAETEVSVDDLEAKYEQSIRFEQMKMFVREVAQRRHAEMTAARDWSPPDDLGSLSDMLDLEWPEDPYLIAGILPEGGNAVLTAQFKTGKTTFVGNVVRSLVDGTPFLDTFEVTRTGPVALWNYELTPRMQIDWLRSLQIRNTHLVHAQHLRGQRMPLLSPAARKWTVAWLKARKISTWIIDPWGPALAQTGGDENSNTDARRLITVLDEIKAEAGVRELIVATHTGRGEAESGQEHARGATVLDDWPDARWILTRLKDSDQRFIRFAGRLPETQEMGLAFDPVTRRLSTVGGGDPLAGMTKRDVIATMKAAEIRAKVLAAITEQPGCSQSNIRKATRIHDREISAAVKELEENGQVRVEEGGHGRATKHYPTALAFPGSPADEGTGKGDGEVVKPAS